MSIHELGADAAAAEERLGDYSKALEASVTGVETHIASIKGSLEEIPGVLDECRGRLEGVAQQLAQAVNSFLERQEQLVQVTSSFKGTLGRCKENTSGKHQAASNAAQSYLGEVRSGQGRVDQGRGDIETAHGNVSSAVEQLFQTLSGEKSNVSETHAKYDTSYRQVDGDVTRCDSDDTQSTNDLKDSMTEGQEKSTTGLQDLQQFIDGEHKSKLQNSLSNTATGTNQSFGSMNQKLDSLSGEFQQTASQVADDISNYFGSELPSQVQKAARDEAMEAVDEFSTLLVAHIASAQAGAGVTSVMVPVLPELKVIHGILRGVNALKSMF